jgi:hypothetical protein
MFTVFYAPHIEWGIDTMRQKWLTEHNSKGYRARLVSVRNKSHKPGHIHTFLS